MSAFKSELETLINRHSMENGSNTPDFILATFMAECLASFDLATRSREAWYSRATKENQATGGGEGS